MESVHEELSEIAQNKAIWDRSKKWVTCAIDVSLNIGFTL